jgi:hypothetical protein
MIILLVISTVCIYLLRRIFNGIYYSFHNITEGEFDERLFQLNSLEDALVKFIKSHYFYEFMGLNITDKMKPNLTKISKKYSDTRYCFNLIFSISSILLFYLIQIGFSSAIMQIIKVNVNTGIWIDNT